jgi:alpha-tubulin suppressor-like RCC1 family protein
LFGRLGDGSTTSSNIPVAVSTAGVLGGKRITAIGAGQFHTCAITDEVTNNAYCWGYNNSGRLGDGSTTNSSIPVAVFTAGVLSGKIITAIGAGEKHTCAITDEVTNNAYCWGYNSDGQLGDNSITNRNIPAAVSTAGVLSGKRITAISAGGYHTCAITDQATNNAYCWGFNATGQLGVGSTTSSNIPAAVSTAGVLSTKRITAIGAGGYHTCAITDEATNNAYCWGKNATGQLGDNSITNSKIPVAVFTAGVLSGKIITAISPGGYSTCAITDEATNNAYCWGDNSEGQLGDNSNTNSNIPVAVFTAGVLSGKSITAISAGAYHTCAITDEATNNAYCWGNNYDGELGDDSTTSSNIPVAVSTAGIVPSGKRITAISAGTYHTCAITDEATNNAYCWGYNGDGELGDNSNADSNIPVAVSTAGIVPSGKRITAISAGAYHTCAITDEATNNAYCWGYNYDGQLGNNSNINRNIPVAVSTAGIVPSGKRITAISAGTYHTCAITDEATNNAYCWGYNGDGELGDNSNDERNTPVAVYTAGVLSTKRITAISAGRYHTCAITDEATNNAYCWGDNSEGQLGDNSNDERNTPVAVYTAGVLSTKRITAISAGRSHTFAITN